MGEIDVCWFLSCFKKKRQKKKTITLSVMDETAVFSRALSWLKYDSCSLKMKFLYFFPDKQYL